jgi:hypothetical protein
LGGCGRHGEEEISVIRSLTDIALPIEKF